MPDQYKYQSIPLPQLDAIGSQGLSSTQVGVDPPADVPGPAVDPTAGDFGPQVAPPFGGGGSGVITTFDAVMYLASTGELVNVTIDGTINP